MPKRLACSHAGCSTQFFSTAPGGSDHTSTASLRLAYAIRVHEAAFYGRRGNSVVTKPS